MGSRPSEDELLEQRRKDFFADYVQPMVHEAREIDVPITEAIVRVIQLHSTDQEN
ncbi:hypothetical protein [Amycolatopsis anabasis]|uniref:hypothetical protein n=1 Tax=Amycolatopsis anabasis TaxID=1840409 RepID=UPI00131B393D|nr:hypothetical protein [Amycolatopsis anabasis]